MCLGALAGPLDFTAGGSLSTRRNSLKVCLRALAGPLDFTAEGGLSTRTNSLKVCLRALAGPLDFTAGGSLSTRRNSLKVCLGALAGPLDFVAGEALAASAETPHTQEHALQGLAGVSRADRRREHHGASRDGAVGSREDPPCFSLPCPAREAWPCSGTACRAG